MEVSPIISSEQAKNNCFSLKWNMGLCIVLALVSGIAGLWLAKSEPVKASIPVNSKPEYSESKKISFSLTIKNASASLIKDASLWVYAPVPLLSYQRCCDQIKTSHPYEIATDDLGNQALQFQLGVFPPYAHQLIHVSTTVNLAVAPNRFEQENLQKFLAESPYIEVNTIKIKNLAALLKVADDKKTARNIYQWVTENLNKRDFTRDVKGALYALNNNQGDCTENAYLFVALARAAGIPARPLGGYMMNNSGILRAADYHNWAEFYVDGTWYLADPHQGVFDRQYENYIATQIIAGGNEGEFTADRYWYKGNGLTVSMN